MDMSVLVLASVRRISFSRRFQNDGFDDPEPFPPPFEEDELVDPAGFRGEF
jgi:hypothetical protein